MSTARADAFDTAMGGIDGTEPAQAQTPGQPPSRRARLPAIDTQRCTGCGWCVAACEPHVLVLEVVRWKKFSALIDPDLCTGCSLCAVKCPVHAITMQKVAAVDASDRRALRAADDAV